MSKLTFGTESGIVRCECPAIDDLYLSDWGESSFMFYVLCFMFYVLCFMFYVLCFQMLQKLIC
ncbi:MAG: hypothetical protein ACJAUM_002033, partial [Pseudomonadales bacterium]